MKRIEVCVIFAQDCYSRHTRGDKSLRLLPVTGAGDMFHRVN